MVCTASRCTIHSTVHTNFVSVSSAARPIQYHTNSQLNSECICCSCVSASYVHYIAAWYAQKFVFLAHQTTLQPAYSYSTGHTFARYSKVWYNMVNYISTVYLRYSYSTPTIHIWYINGRYQVRLDTYMIHVQHVCTTCTVYPLHMGLLAADWWAF